MIRAILFSAVCACSSNAVARGVVGVSGLGTANSSPSTPSLLPLARTSASGAPKGWTFFSNDERRYRTWTDIAQGLPIGTRCSIILGIGPRPDGPGGRIRSWQEEIQSKFGTLMQGVSAEAFHGRRVRLSAQLSTVEMNGEAALWMRVDGANGKVLNFDNMDTRGLTGTTNWSRQEVVLDVPPESAAIEFGVLLRGAGEVRVAQFALDIVDGNTPVTASGVPETRDALPKGPTNLELHL
jgi:hypothetical protein